MQSGDLVFFRGCGFTSWSIRWWTRSQWSHVGVLWVVLDVPLVIETRLGLGVSVSSLANRQSDYPTVVPSGRQLDLDLALHHLGPWYGAGEAGQGDAETFSDRAGWECSELAAALLGLQDRIYGWSLQTLYERVTREW